LSKLTETGWTIVRRVWITVVNASGMYLVWLDIQDSRELRELLVPPGTSPRVVIIEALRSEYWSVGWAVLLLVGLVLEFRSSKWAPLMNVCCFAVPALLAIFDIVVNHETLRVEHIVPGVFFAAMFLLVAGVSAYLYTNSKHKFQRTSGE
jgi:hypothetical protein